MKSKLKKIILLLTCGLFLLNLSACSSNDVGLLLVNSLSPIVDVGSRNKQVLEDLYSMGLISETTMNQQKAVIDTRVLALTQMMSATNLNQIPSGQIDALSNSIVSVLGKDETNGEYGLIDSSCSFGDTFIALNGYRRKTFAVNSDNYDGANNKWHGEFLTKKIKTEKEREVSPLSFVDEQNLESFVKELNRIIYVLDPDKVKTEEDLIIMLDKITLAKQYNLNSEDDKLKNALEDLTQNYFKKTDATVYNYTTNSILTNTTDNSSQLGRTDVDNSMLNKDVVLSGVVSGVLHKVTTTGEPPTKSCNKQDATATVGVMTIRVREFDSNLREQLNNSVFTNNRYIPFNGKDAGLSTDIALLMEYPVQVLDSIEQKSVGSNAWKMNFVDSDMRINIYNGEMLLKDSSGNYVVVNKEDDANERLYRVSGVNAGKATTSGKRSSFMINGEGRVDVSSINDYTDYKIKLLTRLDVDTSDVKEDYGIEFGVWYPDSYKKKDGIEYETVGNNYKFKSAGLSDLEVSVTSLNNIDSYLLSLINDISLTSSTWDDLWNFYETKAKEINRKHSNNGSSFSEDKTEWVLYKLYKALVDTGKVTADKPADLFSTRFLANAFYEAFLYDTPNSSTISSYILDYYTDYDYAYLKAYKHGETFDYVNSGNDCIFKWELESNVKDIDTIKETAENLDDKVLVSYFKRMNKEDSLSYSYILSKLEKYAKISSTISDTNIGKIITNIDGANLTFNSSTGFYEYKYNGILYSCTAPYKDGAAGSINASQGIENVTTVRFALTDYLELTYIPEVITDEDFIATGRRISITSFEGTGDTEVGFFTNKLGDRAEGGNVDILMSDLIDSESGVEYYDKIAKVISSVQTNSTEVENEVKSPTKESLSELFVNDIAEENDTGLINDRKLLKYKVGFSKIEPIIKFTSEGRNKVQGLDAMDVNNANVKKGIYYGLCVNTHAFNSGLYVNWIDINGDGGDNGSLKWWNTWLSTHGYEYRIDIAKLKNKMSGVYAASLALIDNTIVFDENALKVINKEINTHNEEQMSSLLRTVTTLVGGFLLIYGLLLMGLWVLDVNMVNGPGLVTIATFGKFVSIRDRSEVPLMPGDGKIYVDFKALFVATIIFMIVGILLIAFDLKVFWDLIPEYSRSFTNKLQDIFLNK